MRYTKPKLIQLIHIAKQKLAMDEFSYRAMLERLTNKNSCAKMTTMELIKVYDEMQQKGFKATANKTHSPTTKNARVKSNITHKIRAIWIDMYKQGIVKDGSEKALNKFMQNTLIRPQMKQGSTLLKLNVQSLNDSEATQLLEILKKWKGRATK